MICPKSKWVNWEIAQIFFFFPKSLSEFNISIWILSIWQEENWSYFIFLFSSFDNLQSQIQARAYVCASSAWQTVDIFFKWAFVSFIYIC